MIDVPKCKTKSWKASLGPSGRFACDAEMDFTPMIDMVFLLLIFFLVASKIDQADVGETASGATWCGDCPRERDHRHRQEGERKLGDRLPP